MYLKKGNIAIHFSPLVCRPNIQYIRIIRNKTPNQYMVLIKFSHQSYADEFYKNFSGVPFNSMEADLCHLVYVSKVEMQTSQVRSGRNLFDLLVREYILNLKTD